MVHIVLVALTLACARPAFAFTFDDVAKRAETLAAQAYRPPDETLPDTLKKLDYDAYRDIRYKPARALWRNDKLPFEVMFFHRGRAFAQRVLINELADATVRPIAFNPSHFDYGANKFDASSFGPLGFAGFRVHYPVNTPKYKDEVLVFLGASYFRALGRGQRYGLSARALAIDIAAPTGEEFPRFTEFWIERPKLHAGELVVYALLDSPRCTGAYRFTLKPGVDTALDVKSRVFLRAGVSTLGVAPLTSMFLHGENQPGRVDDYRPEVHDSDGLSVYAGNGEWIWRPLSDPKQLLITSFSTIDPRGFGLMQRDRRFSSYEDLEARYDLRPSAWIEPKGRWGEGRVELVQIPSPNETNDNIVAYWVPTNLPAPKKPLDLEYRVLWQKETERKPTLAWVAQSRRGRGYTPKADDSIQFVVDFEGPSLSKLPPDAEIDADLTLAGNAELIEKTLQRNEITGGSRLTVRIKRIDPNKPVELRAVLKKDHESLSETWSNILPRT